MISKTPKIVVITPVKNEAWILDLFLAVTSQFAEHIIIADQNSTDETPNICQKYQKVTLIENKSEVYDEASRQMLLLQKARDLVPGYKIILALDADEILAANAMKTPGWQSMLQAKPGTVLCFEKPDLYLTPDQCIRYDTPWPIGYVDDGAEHKPKKIHSIRIPMPDYAPRLHIHDVKILHYSLIRPTAQASKMRLYSVIENVVNSTPSAIKRRLAYPSKKSYINQGKLENSPVKWFAQWEDIGIDMHTICCDKYYWQDFEVLTYFQKYGLRKFWLDDIWDFDWESCRLYAESQQIRNIPEYSILAPPKVIKILISVLTKLYFRLKKLSYAAARSF